MRRRDRGHPAISLFAFQDVMASVIGVLFFVVLLLAFDIVNRDALAVGAVGEPVSESQLQDFRQKLGSLEQDLLKLNGRIKEHTEKINLASTDEHEMLGEIKGLSAKLSTLRARIGEDERAALQLRRETALKEEQHRGAKKELDELEHEAASLKGAPRSARPAPNIAYIIDPRGDNLEPWLLEVAADSLRVASRDGTTTVLDFKGTSEEIRTKQLLAWARSQDSRTHYFVILVKPSGVKLLERLGYELKKRGFDIGMDLLPEDWYAF